jgi:hypothetical protein
MMRKLLFLFAIVGLLSVPSFADTLYGDNATGGTPYIYAINPATGAILNTYTNLSGYNGRGVVTVGNIMYYTTASDNNVYKYDLSTNTNLGVAFSVAGSTALSTMAYDGKDFWIGDYSGTNHAYLYSPTGTLLNTISLGDCSSYCDGLEYFRNSSGQGRLISNRFDGGYGGQNYYDVYDTNGNLLQADLITAVYGGSTGIAWDGSNFWTSNIFAGTVSEWNGSGAFMQTVTLTGAPGGYSPLIEDLSYNYSKTLSPEPGSIALLGTGLISLIGFARRRLS